MAISPCLIVIMQAYVTRYSSEVTLRELRISCDGSEYAQATILQGDLLPLEFTFSGFLPNGVLMYAFNKDMVSSCNAHIL